MSILFLIACTSSVLRPWNWEPFPVSVNDVSIRSADIGFHLCRSSGVGTGVPVDFPNPGSSNDLVKSASNIYPLVPLLLKTAIESSLGLENGSAPKKLGTSDSFSSFKIDLGGGKELLTLDFFANWEL